MKTKRLKAKLILNKQTISNVSMNSVKIGFNDMYSVQNMCDFSQIIHGEKVGFDASCGCYNPGSVQNCSGGPLSVYCPEEPY